MASNPWRANDHQDHMIIDQPAPPQNTMLQETDSTQDSRVASLKAIFPDFDDTVILSVLESTNNDHDRALDVLLGMNDPSFVPPHPPRAQPQLQSPPSSDTQRFSQEALDEQLARRLALEEQQAATQTWQPQGMQDQAMYQPYQPRRGGRNGWSTPPQGQPQMQGQSGRDTMTDLQDGFSRIAESGKKTFSSIVSKVKAKMQEFDQGQGWSWSQNPPSNQPPPGTSYATSYTQAQPQGFNQSPYTQRYQYAPPPNPPPQTQTVPQTTSTVSPPPRSGMSPPSATEPAPSVSAQQPSYYDPNNRGYDLYDDDVHEIQLHDNRTPATVVPTPAPAVSATTPRPATLPPNVESVVSLPPPSDTSAPPSYASPVSSPPNSGLPSSRPLSPTNAGVKGTSPSTPGGVDFSKLGLLPKRPISLVRPQSPPAAGSAGASLTAPRVTAANSKSSSTDREESEFVENPFEDRK